MGNKQVLTIERTSIGGQTLDPATEKVIVNSEVQQQDEDDDTNIQV